MTLGGTLGSMANTPRQTIRVDQALWDLAGEVAQAAGTNRSEEINTFLRWRTGEPGVELPEPAMRAPETA